MAEIGAGSGTSYPASLDTNTTTESSSTSVRADVPNDLAAAIIAVQTELGTDPAGSITDVKTYLQTEHNANGTHSNTLVAMLAGTQTIAGTKTFSAQVISTLATGTSPLSITSTTVCTNLNVEQHNGLKVKVVDIGDWKMDTTATVTVAHGLTGANIRSVDVIIRSDDDGTIEILPLDYSNVFTDVAGKFVINSSGGVVLTRGTGGFFSSSDFDSTSYNRGWITIWYV